MSLIIDNHRRTLRIGSAILIVAFLGVISFLVYTSYFSSAPLSFMNKYTIIEQETIVFAPGDLGINEEIKGKEVVYNASYSVVLQEARSKLPKLGYKEARFPIKSWVYFAGDQGNAIVFIPGDRMARVKRTNDQEYVSVVSMSNIKDLLAPLKSL